MSCQKCIIESDEVEMEGEAAAPTHSNDGDAHISALLLCCSPFAYGVLKAAIEMKLFEIISEASMSASQIASHLPTHYPALPRKLHRVLLLLASHSLLTCSTHTHEDGRTDTLYRLSPAGRYFLRNHPGGFFAPFLALATHPALMEVWLNFKGAILDGDDDLFKKVHGMTLYQFMETDPTLNDAFSNGMANFSTAIMESILQKYEGFEGLSTLVDVGGGKGKTLQMIISQYPSIKGINFDLPHVIANAQYHPGIEHVGGDMFAFVPEGADAILLKNICHNWSDEECLRILKNCEKALPENGKVIVVDYMMPKAAATSDAIKYFSIIDNLMFIFGGKERTEKEFEALCKGSGFARFQVIDCALSALTLMEFYK